MSDDSLLEFPCKIPIKVFGRNQDAFRQAVISVIRRHFESLPDSAVTERLSRADKYLSLTVTVVAQSRSQIDAAYRDLSAHEHVVMVL